MDQTTPLTQAGQFSARADRFTALRTQLTTEAAEPGTGTGTGTGTDGLRHLTPLLTRSQDLVRR